MLQDCVFTSESVTEGHPDKMADSISDTLLDAMLAQDPKSRVACETMVTTGMVVVAGEVTTEAQIDFQKLIRKRIGEIGYDHSSKSFDAQTCAVLVALDKQSPDIAQGVNEGEGSFLGQGAGDQGLMFGYAIDETENLMPATIDLSHKLAWRLAEIRKSGLVPELGPDGKTQVSVEYTNGKIARLSNIVVSTQHLESFSLGQVEEAVREEVVKKVIPSKWLDDKTKIWINPTGKFVIGGPLGDCGLTGRKIIVDTYGGHGAHGGGAFSGKDPSKVDRSAAYAARCVAKHIVAADLAERALVQVAYAIGVAEPMSLMVETFGTEKVNCEKLNKAIGSVFDLRPRAIIDWLDLMRPIYTPASTYGHFGRVAENGFFPWESLGKIEELRSHF